MKDNFVLETIFSRRSIRSYEDTPLKDEQINSLLEAALISPSAVNQQPWHITVLTNQDVILEWEREIINYFIDIKDDFTAKRNESRGNKIFYNAPAVFVISMEKGKEIDVGIMAQSIALAAKSMGLDSVILGLPRVSFDPRYNDKWNEKLNFPKDYLYGISVAVGYGKDAGIDRQIDISKVSYLG
ncbi:MAG: nitroreductase family protein [Epulopiscium sp.]|nr:nitroreductase family protein [Candidatus Epulonipiscium sp.]